MAEMNNTTGLFCVWIFVEVLFLTLRVVCDSREGTSQDEKRAKVSEEKSPSYFFFCVIYGNSPRQSGAMNRIWWSQGRSANEKPAIVEDVLLTSGSSGVGLFQTGVCFFKAERGSQNNEAIYQTQPPSSEMTCCHFRYQLSCVEVTTLHHSATGGSSSKWILHLELYLQQLMC